MINGATKVAKEYSVQTVLELACAAQRTYGDYLKEAQTVFDNEGKFICLKHSNKDLVKYALGATRGQYQQEYRPIDLILSPEDAAQAEEIKKYFRRLMFNAVKGDNEFYTEVNSILNNETVSDKKIGFVACLPSVYFREVQKKDFTKRLNACENAMLGDVGTSLFDKDCEILQVKYSQNFNAWNVLAIINNHLASWMSSKEVKTGPAVLIKAKIKGVAENWHTKKVETRLNYVKVAQ